MEKDFETWWHNEGSGMPPLAGEDVEAHVHRICKIAWLNGAFKAIEVVKNYQKQLQHDNSH